ncbi:uncharacterized protein ARMOST_07492 [Armillaria ostoyae]|uniref:Uncharacterized protein n=1 Tax=Armillaria ostoyae TaxID=47428 RepID=A0A284R621_ARMOS|nr:uncharacterized protein ARMOST_07492 [Armillaria ostoyae]
MSDTEQCAAIDIMDCTKDGTHSNAERLSSANDELLSTTSSIDVVDCTEDRAYSGAKRLSSERDEQESLDRTGSKSYTVSERLSLVNKELLPISRCAMFCHILVQGRDDEEP